MASIKFNPFTNKFDYVGAGGSGVSYIDGEVADSSLLPVTLGFPAIGDVYLAKAGSGVWLINRRPAGLYSRTANNGNLDDWTYLSAFPEVQADSRFRIYNATDATKEVAFDASAIAAGTTRTISVPNKNVTLGVNADWNASSGDAQILNKPASFTPSTHGSSHHTGGTDAIAPSSIGAAASGAITNSGLTGTGGGRIIGRITAGSGALAEIGVSSPLTFTSGNLALLSGSIPTASSATPQALGVAAAGTSTNYARADHVHAMPSAADVGAAAATHAASHATGGSDPLFDQDLNTLDDVTFDGVTTDVVTCAAFADASENTQLQFDDGIHRLINNAAETVTISDSDASFQVPIAFGGDNAATNAATTRTNLGLGDSATADIGTGSTEVAAGDHSHELDELDATGATLGHVLTADGSNGASWQAASGGGVSAVNSTLADILSVSGSDLVADDLGSDKLYGWDDSESKAIGFTVSTGLETDGTNLKAKITSDPTGVTGADAITNIMSLTQAEYNAIGSPDAATLYLITDP